MSTFIYYLLIVWICFYQMQAKPIPENAELFEAEFQMGPNSATEMSTTTIPNDTIRFQRQVIQPKWLQQGGGRAPKVAEQRFNEQFQRNAEDLREMVGRTLDAAIAAMDSKKENTRKTARKGLTRTRSRMNFVGSARNQALEPTEEENFIGKFKTLWLKFLENSNEMLASMPGTNDLQQFQKFWKEFLESSKKAFD